MKRGGDFLEYPNIKAELSRKGMTAGEFATILGVTQSTFSNWMNGRTNIDMKHAKEIAKELDMSMDYLFAN